MTSITATAITAALSLTVSPVSEAQQDIPTPMEFCTSTSEMAEAVMSARQGGVPMREAMEIMEGREFHERMVMVAYERNRYSTQEYQQEAITEFGNAWFSACMKSPGEPDHDLRHQ